MLNAEEIHTILLKLIDSDDEHAKDSQKTGLADICAIWFTPKVCLLRWLAWFRYCTVGNIDCMFRLTEYDLANGIKHCHGSDRWRHGCRRRALKDEFMACHCNESA